MLLMYGDTIQTVNDIYIVHHPEIGYGFEIGVYYYFSKLFEQSKEEIKLQLLEAFKSSKILLSHYIRICSLDDKEIKIVQIQRRNNQSHMRSDGLGGWIRKSVKSFSRRQG